MDLEQLKKMSEETYETYLEITNNSQEALQITTESLRHMGFTGDITAWEYTLLVNHLQEYNNGRIPHNEIKDDGSPI